MAFAFGNDGPRGVRTTPSAELERVLLSGVGREEKVLALMSQRDWLVRCLRRRLAHQSRNPEADAEDTVHDFLLHKADTFVQWYEKHGGAPLSFLLIALKNTAIDGHRHRKEERQRTLSPTAALVSREEAPDQGLERAEELQKFRRCLSPMQEQVFTSRYCEGRSAEETAKRLGLSVAQVYRVDFQLHELARAAVPPQAGPPRERTPRLDEESPVPNLAAASPGLRLVQKLGRVYGAAGLDSFTALLEWSGLFHGEWLDNNLECTVRFPATGTAVPTAARPASWRRSTAAS